MGNFAPMHCQFCDAGPYTGPSLGERFDDPHAKQRTYDCESSYSDYRVDTWNVTTRCAERALARYESLRAAVEDVRCMGYVSQSGDDDLAAGLDGSYPRQRGTRDVAR